MPPLDVTHTGGRQHLSFQPKTHRQPKLPETSMVRIAEHFLQHADHKLDRSSVQLVSLENQHLHRATEHLDLCSSSLRSFSLTQHAALSLS